MESSHKHKNRLASRIKRVARVAALFALAGSLYSGDKTEYEGSIWTGDENALSGRLASAGRSAPLNNPERLRVATYNIKAGSIDREEVIKTARALGADVLGLTEAGSVAREIARDDYEVVNGGAGNVLLTKYPVIEHFSENLPIEPGGVQRTALFAKLDIGTTNGQWFVLNHLEHDDWPKSSEAIRLRQIEAMQKTIDERLDGPAIVIGDPNFGPGSPEFQAMDVRYDDALTELGIGNIGTFKGFLGSRRLDYIFIPNDLGYEPVAGGRSESDGSDHWPIMVVLQPEQGPVSLPTVLE